MRENDIPMRNAFGNSLVELGKIYPDLVVLDADVSSSTRTAYFGQKFPERFFNVGVAEANMVDIAAGLASCGLKPVASTFAVFLCTKCCDQIRNILAYCDFNVILAGGYAGISDSYDGSSHQCTNDLAIMRSIPNVKVIVPADNKELSCAIEAAMNLTGPVYVRICRNATPDIFDDANPFEFGKIRRLREGADVTIAATGVAVSMALEAARDIRGRGFSAEVLNVSTIKPLDVESLVESVKKTGCIITAEEHSIIGGLGSAVAENLINKVSFRMEMIGIKDSFTESGSYISLLKEYGISKEKIVEKAITLVNEKHS